MFIAIEPFDNRTPAECNVPYDFGLSGQSWLLIIVDNKDTSRSSGAHIITGNCGYKHLTPPEWRKWLCWTLAKSPAETKNTDRSYFAYFDPLLRSVFCLYL